MNSCIYVATYLSTILDLGLLNNIKFFIQLSLSTSVCCTNKYTLGKRFWNHLLSFKTASEWLHVNQTHSTELPV